MKQIVRLTFLFSLLFGLILLVHQGIRLQAADYLIAAFAESHQVLNEWQRAGEGTRLLLQLFAAGAIITLLIYYLRVLQGEEYAPRSYEAIAPLTNALRDLKRQESRHQLEKSVAVAQMKEIRALQTTILEGVNSGVLTVDESGRIATCNPAACAILGWQGEPPVGRPIGELFRGEVPAPLEQRPASQGAPQRLEFDWNPPGHPPKSLGLSFSIIHTPAGRLTAMLFSDLTEVKRLRRKVELRRHLAQLGEVSAGIAHEFRNNMGAVMGYSRLIAHDIAPDSPAREVLDAMMRELTGMEQLIRDLLDFSRQEELQVKAVPVEPLARNAAEVGSAGFPVDASCSVSPGLPPLLADEVRLRQSLINLVRNACEAVTGAPMEQPPRVAVTVKAATGEDSDGPPQWITISVADNGKGLDPQTRDRIFLPFFTTKESGTGMGLAHVHKTVTHHGGEVLLEDTPGGGATFRLRLPTIHHKGSLAPQPDVSET